MDHPDHDSDNPIVAEEQAVTESDPLLESDEADPEWAESEAIEKETDTQPAQPAELAAVHTDTEAAQEASGDDEAQSGSAAGRRQPAKQAAAKASQAVSPVKRSLARRQPRSAKYAAAAARVNKQKAYQPKEALTLAKETSYAKFDAAIEVHIKLVEKKGKGADGDRLRILVALPYGTGREPKIGVLDEALIEKIKQAGDTEFDILLSSPALMSKVAQIAKILGPKGKMPNPKTGTVTDDPAAATAAIVSGRVELRADPNQNIHQPIGRASWPAEKLLENYQALMASVPTNRLQRVTVSATMGPSLTIDHA